MTADPFAPDENLDFFTFANDPDKPAYIDPAKPARGAVYDPTQDFFVISEPRKEEDNPLFTVKKSWFGRNKLEPLPPKPIVDPYEVAKREVDPPTTSTWVTGGLLGVTIIVSLFLGGLSSALFIAGQSSLMTSYYTLGTGRPGWARLPSRKAATIPIGVAVVMFLLASAVG